ncbi:hypothetical protein EWB00_004517 [Schistosoma japonicum]|uniref:Uncharacterized protein n=1 Tax=Schistosoma japonicum TaxID=6182 RepID=A0A4Z2DUV0_SCHJA|nr:hypothetical protein KSF78_0006280 [Schistosoma japonicum]KAH8871586.1 hypothetical protein KSF78_0006280 [Schistosoma japonicum]TNN20236.1 hypothetical protein EWB00_004517 [Schistosoma japonicum]TNN20237.1 hypothetical protein EWB00_004517 [Schistosoma japonicum]
MSSIAVQTEEVVDRINNCSSLSIDLFTQILSILGDEQNNFHYDISESQANFPPECNHDGDNTNGTIEAIESYLDDDTTDFQINNDNINDMTTTELERSLQISESRLRNNLNELNKISSASSSPSQSSISYSEYIREWLNSTCDDENNSTLNSPNVELVDGMSKNKPFTDVEMDGI